MKWKVLFSNEFEKEFNDYKESLQDELLAHVGMIETFGPSLGRPKVDTLKASKHKNFKELRFSYKKEVWRFIFVFDPKRRAVVLVGGNKRGKNQFKFYDKLIKIAEKRYKNHLNNIG